ncbi:helix-turn-helix domain containing protein [Asanoa sp. WMMD1127]|uniref:TetR/AcrR family transcriptional regulator n=1 Tax=Asanoa sp. WMMD1127 TaxID=3016107 RepID=UPI002417768B|nr:TetR/AcrR family transcriptional regulator [Asanoa sp. WMMD1127]MDG4827101.1 helix-turn-helix domain containing protein [Asanoa sp. WMMD1127]
MTTRRYQSAVRAEQSRATRQRVLDAARALFVRRGYTGSTVEAIAARAQVSVQTVYNTVGGKAAVLKAVYDVTIAGDADPIPMIDRPTGRALRATHDARECLMLYARMSREIYERIGPLVPILLTEGAAGDREVRTFIDTIENERAIGTKNIAQHVADRFGLRPDLSVDDAADVLWTLTAPDALHRLVRRRRWSLDRYETWLGQTLADALLGPGR